MGYILSEIIRSDCSSSGTICVISKYVSRTEYSGHDIILIDADRNAIHGLQYILDIPDNYDTVIIDVDRRFYCRFDISRLGPSVTTIRTSASIELFGNPPVNLRFLTSRHFPDNYYDFFHDTGNLEILCTGDITNDRVLPSGLKVLVCNTPPTVTPESLRYVCCFKLDGPLSKSVEHLVCGWNNYTGFVDDINDNMFDQLVTLHISSNETCGKLDMRSCLPKLKTLSIFEYGYLGCEIFFKKNDLLELFDPSKYIADSRIPAGTYSDEDMRVDRLPLSLENLYLAASVKIGSDFGELVNLKTLFYQITDFDLIKYPRSLRYLGVGVDSKSEFWLDTKRISNFVAESNHIDVLTLPTLSPSMVDIFSDNCVIPIIHVRYYPNYDLRNIRSQIIADTIHGFYGSPNNESMSFHSKAPIGIVISGGFSYTKTQTSAGSTIILHKHGITYDILGTCESLDNCGNKIEVTYITVPGEYIPVNQKSARNIV